MKWYESWAPYLVVTVDGSFAAITCVLLRNSTIMDIILPILIFFLLYPIAILSSYIWINGVGHEYICGVDWDKLDDNGKKSACKTIGMWMTLGIIVDMYGLALILFDLFLGIGVAIAGVVVTGIGFISVWVNTLKYCAVLASKSICA